MLGLVQPGPVQRLGALPGQREHRGAFLRGEGRPPVREAQHDGAHGPGRAAEHERHGDQPAGVGATALPQRLARAGGVRRRVLGVHRQPPGRGRDRIRAPRGEDVEVLRDAQQHRGRARAEPHGVVQDDVGDVHEPGRAGEGADDLAELLGRPPRRALGGQQPGALERLRAQLGQHGQCGACSAGAHVPLPAEPDHADAHAGSDQGDAVGGVAAGLGPHGLARAGGLGGGRYGDRDPVRRQGRVVGDSADGFERGFEHRVVAGAVHQPQRDRARPGQPGELLGRGRRDLLGCGRGGQRRGGPLQNLEPRPVGLLALQQRGVVQRRRRAFREVAEQREVAVVERGGAAAPGDREQARGLAAGVERDERDRAEPDAAPQLALPLVGAAGKDEGLVDLVLPDLAGRGRARPHPVGVELVQQRFLLGAVRRDGPTVGGLPVADLDEARHVGQALVDERAHERPPPPLDGGLPVQRSAHHGEQALPFALADAAVDVQATPDVAAHVPLGRGPAVEHPPVVAACGPQPVLDLERPAGRRGTDPVVVGAVGGVDALLPGQAQVGVRRRRR